MLRIVFLVSLIIFWIMDTVWKIVQTVNTKEKGYASLVTQNAFCVLDLPTRIVKAAQTWISYHYKENASISVLQDITKIKKEPVKYVIKIAKLAKVNHQLNASLVSLTKGFNWTKNQILVFKKWIRLYSNPLTNLKPTKRKQLII